MAGPAVPLGARGGREADVMTTSNGSIPLRRIPLRLRMGEAPAPGGLQGGWWPQSRDLAVELADLVDHFLPERGRIVRATYSPPDWDPAPRRVPVARGYVKVGSFPRDDTHPGAPEDRGPRGAPRPRGAPGHVGRPRRRGTAGRRHSRLHAHRRL